MTLSVFMEILIILNILELAYLEFGSVARSDTRIFII